MSSVSPCYSKPARERKKDRGMERKEKHMNYWSQISLVTLRPLPTLSLMKSVPATGFSKKHRDRREEEMRPQASERSWWQAVVVVPKLHFFIISTAFFFFFWSKEIAGLLDHHDTMVAQLLRLAFLFLPTSLVTSTTSGKGFPVSLDSLTLIWVAVKNWFSI